MNLYYKESKSKKNFFLGGGGGGEGVGGKAGRGVDGMDRLTSPNQFAPSTSSKKGA